MSYDAGIGSVGVPGREFPAQTIYTDTGHDTYYVPFVADDGRVGYRVGNAVEADGPDGEAASWETFVYLNPSQSTLGPNPAGDVFLYVGVELDMNADEAIVFAVIDDEAFGHV